jgi:predicted dehydrogenase
MTTAPLQVLLIGLGQIGMGYDLALDPERYVLSHARAYVQHPDFRLCAGVDPDAGQRATFTERFGAPAHAGLEEALARHKPDVVAVALPTALHRDAVERVLACARPAAILCEKPLAYDIGDARAMVALCEEAGVPLYVNYIRRSDIAAIEVAQRLRAGAIAGPGIKGVCWYSKGFRHNGSHFFNLLQFWLGPMQRFHLIDAGRQLADGDAEPDVQVAFRDGTVTFLAAREEQFSHYTIELVAANGRLRYEQGGRSVLWQPAGPDPRLPAYTVLAPEPEQLATGLDRYQWQVAENLARALRGDAGAALCSGAEALATLEAIDSIIQ